MALINIIFNNPSEDRSSLNKIKLTKFLLSLARQLLFFDFLHLAVDVE